MTKKITYLPLDTSVYGFSRVITRLKAAVADLTLPADLKQAILKRFDARADIAVVSEGTMLRLHWRGGDAGTSTALGLYLPNQELSPNVTRGQVYLCPTRCIGYAEMLGVPSEVIYGTVHIHELGHHVFKLSEDLVRGENRRFLSEGLANFLVFLLAQSVEPDLLELKTRHQPREYSFYQVFVEWFSTDETNCVRALTDLIRGNEAEFLASFLAFAITRESLINGFSKSLIGDILISLVNSGRQSVIIDKLVSQSEEVIPFLLNKGYAGMEETVYGILMKKFFDEGQLEVDKVSGYSVLSPALLQNLAGWALPRYRPDVDLPSPDGDVYLRLLDAASRHDLRTASKLFDQLFGGAAC